MLRDAPLHVVGRYEQQPRDAGQRRGEPGGGVVVERADVDAQRGEVGGPRGIAGERDDLARRDPLQQRGDDEPAQLAGGSGDGVHGVLRSVMEPAR